MMNGLTDEHAVKGVPMVGRQPAELQHRLFLQGKRLDSVAVAIFGDENLRWIGQRKLADPIFHRYLPGRDRAQIDLVLGITENLPSCGRQ